jgi:hypothetical protein
MNTKEERKIAFRLLNAAEKAEVWKKHLLECAKEATLTNEQKNFILGVIPILKAERFINPLNKGDKNSQVDDLLVQSGKLFKNREYDIGWLFYDITINKPIFKVVTEETIKTSQSPNLQTRKLEDCECSILSQYCGYPQSIGCYKWTFYCEMGSCTVGSWGCGTFWWYECNGKCVERRQCYCPGPCL